MALATEGGIGEDAVPRWNAWGRRIIIVWGDEINDKKIKNILCRGLKWPLIRRKRCNNQQKTSAFNEGGMEHDVRAAGSIGGGRIDRFHGDYVK